MFTRIGGSLFYDTLFFSGKNIKTTYFPKVSFVIPCKNEENAIYNTISKCFEVDYPANLVEVIAINDGSTDKTLNEMHKAEKDYSGRNLKIISWEKNKGKREGMIHGFRNSTGDIIIQLDSDSYPSKTCLTYLLTPFKDKKVAAVSAHSDPANKDTNILTKMQAAYYFMSFRAMKATESLFEMVLCCPGCCSAYRREYVLPVLEEFNNETFLGRKYTFGDDRSLTYHMLKKGYKTLYVSKAQAYTIVPDKFKQFVKQQIRWKKSWLINSLKVSKFIFKRDKFVALTYFFPLLFITIISPFVLVNAIIFFPLFGFPPIYYVLGIFLIYSLFYFHYKVYDGGKYGKYLFLWAALNVFLLSYLFFYAIYDLKNTSWGTR